jgi:hypothetical protein
MRHLFFDCASLKLRIVSMNRVDAVSDSSTLRSPEQPGSPRESMKKHLLGKIIFFTYWRGTFLREKYQRIYDFTNLELFS